MKLSLSLSNLHLLSLKVVHSHESGQNVEWSKCILTPSTRRAQSSLHVISHRGSAPPASEVTTPCRMTGVTLHVKSLRPSYTGSSGLIPLRIIYAQG
ncbi:hypothetical protein T484DRAFT_1975893 [Baffinella frigidus]|nr:hypothetical protein T484DRAFT_1975893 [Cryptophyta sp. CCMP2293]